MHAMHMLVMTLFLLTQAILQAHILIENYILRHGASMISLLHAVSCKTGSCLGRQLPLERGSFFGREGFMILPRPSLLYRSMGTSRQ
ncbi:hypothetical protein EDD36DRAFT_12371 [Exophiala viscosa]|uniref:Secreted protein n=1 Tax=Exophiala viscosa TaxID=2486360 RepID=A0AAN6E5H2_9EURO|nr:hypothetical protein EDD36DRAFT_12371 [Exophiala viscosa]